MGKKIERFLAALCKFGMEIVILQYYNSLLSSERVAATDGKANFNVSHTGQLQRALSHCKNV